jgi:hypothetical protein
MKRKKALRVVGINLLLFALLFGVVSLNKQVLRPTFNHLSFANVILGCFPNFMAALIISLAVVNGVLLRQPKHARLFVYLSSALVFVILTVEEILPMWGASTYYDTFDILASGLGSLLSVLFFELLFRKRQPRPVEP